jgi:hypothetical protein
LLAQRPQPYVPAMTAVVLAKTLAAGEGEGE